jgi:hypothetical protein
VLEKTTACGVFQVLKLSYKYQNVNNLINYSMWD